MSALLIDVGNTAIKWCIERDGVLGEVTRCERSLADFVESLSVIGTDISQVAIASVAGADFEQQLAQALGDITGAAVAFARTAAAADRSTIAMQSLSEWVSTVGWRCWVPLSQAKGLCA